MVRALQENLRAAHEQRAQVAVAALGQAAQDGAVTGGDLLVYLNENWSEEWGGDLELWDRTGKHCVQRIAPLFNRAVIFDTSNFSYHGHPRPLQCPEERSRKSLALYYYTVEAPAEDDRTPHTTVFIQTEGVETPETV